MSDIVDLFSYSNVQLVTVESPGPGGKIDPHRAIADPTVGTLYVLWERRADHSVGLVGVVVAVREPPLLGVRLIVNSGPVVDALGSLIVEYSFRLAACESRLEALETLRRRDVGERVGS